MTPHDIANAVSAMVDAKMVTGLKMAEDGMDFEMNTTKGRTQRLQFVFTQDEKEVGYLNAFSLIGPATDDAGMLKNLLAENMKLVYSRVAIDGDGVVCQVYRCRVDQIELEEFWNALRELAGRADALEKQYFRGSDDR